MSTALHVMLVVVLGYFFLNQKLQRIDVAQEEKAFRKVAIFLPASHPALDEITQGFMRTLESESDARNTFDVYNANGNKTLMRAQSEEIAAGDYDVVFTVGSTCTKTMKEVTTKKQINLPIIFGAVGNPVAAGIVPSLNSSGNHITGVIEGINYDRQLFFLKSLKPNCKSVLLVFDPSANPIFEQDCDEIAKACTAFGLKFQALQVYNTNEISQKVPALIDTADTLLILKDHTTVGALDNLVKLCNQAKKTLYASDLNSGDKGAALSFGIREEDTGIAAARVAKEIFAGRAPRDIPIASVEPIKIKLNKRVMHQQDLDVPALYIDLMAFGEVV